MKQRMARPLKILVVDVGGTYVNCDAADHKPPVKFKIQAQADTRADEPHNLGAGSVSIFATLAGSEQAANNF